MVIVSGEFVLAPDDVQAFLAGRADRVRTSRAERGCEEYTFAADPYTPGRVLLFELWASRADLDAHLGGMRGAPAPAGPSPISTDIVVWDATPAPPLGR